MRWKAGFSIITKKVKTGLHRCGRTHAVLIVTGLLLLFPQAVFSQELEPRLLTNVPVGTNFAVVSYSYSSGNILLDPAVPIEDLDANLHAVVLGYVRTIDFFGLSGKVDVIVPMADGYWEGKVSGRDSSTAREGFGDPRMRISVNFAGAPALRAEEYSDFRQNVIFGASFQVIAPLGQYDPSKFINLSSNRWAFKSQLGGSITMGNWIIESYLAAWVFTTNPDFYGGNVLKQHPLGAFKVHAIYTMPQRRSWLAFDMGYALGGRTEINGTNLETRISTFRFGTTIVVPLAQRHTIKLTGLTGVRHERGPDFDAVALTYQYRWGGQ